MLRAAEKKRLGVLKRGVISIGTAGLMWGGAGLCGAQEGGGADLSTAGLGRIEKTLEGERELRSRVEAFFKAIEAGDTAGAYSELLKGSPLGGNRESIDGLVEDTSKVLETYGAMRSHELVAIHRVGSRYEIEDTSRRGTRVAGQVIRRSRLQSGDQIVIGGTVLEFEERAKRTPV